MATVTLDSRSVLVRLSRAEKLLGVRRADLRLPLDSVRSVVVHEDGLAQARGLRAPGLAVPGRLKIGTWRAAGKRSFVAVRRGVRTLEIELAGAPLDALLISTPHADALADALRRRRVPSA